MKINKTQKYNTEKFKRGFSVLEVMIALVILAITIIPSVNLFGTTVKYTINIHDIQVGMRLAQDAVENFSASSFSELRSVLSGSPDYSLLPESGQTAVVTTQFVPEHRNINHEFDKFKRKATLSKLEGSDDMLLIEVSVWWYDGDFSKSKPDQRFVTLSTVIHRDFVL